MTLDHLVGFAQSAGGLCWCSLFGDEVMRRKRPSSLEFPLFTHRNQREPKDPRTILLAHVSLVLSRQDYIFYVLIV